MNRLGRDQTPRKRRYALIKTMSTTQFQTPQELGGSNASQHTKDLDFLLNKGLVESELHARSAEHALIRHWRLTKEGAKLAKQKLT